MNFPFMELAVSVSVQATLVVAAAYWIGYLTESERIRCRVWTTCYLVLLFLVVNAATLPHPRFFQPPQPATRSVAAEIVTLQIQVGDVLFQLWILGCIGSLIVFIYRTIQAEKFLRQCQAVDPDIVSLAHLTGDGFENDHPAVGQRTVQLVSSVNITSPFCWQLHQPYIVIPESLLTYEHNDLKYIFKHELAHLQTGHPMQVFVQRMTEIIFWFHPMVWWASRCSALDREFLCDDEAVQTRGDIVNYLKTLLMIVEQTTEQSSFDRNLSFVRNRCELAERARRLVRIGQQPEKQEPASKRSINGTTASISLIMVTAICIVFAWLPINLQASPDSGWSPWPRWTAGVLNDFGIKARDFEAYDHRYALHELLEDQKEEQNSKSELTTHSD